MRKYRLINPVQKHLLLLCFMVWGVANTSQAQTAKKRYSNLTEALSAQWMLSGNSGPASVNWINEGEKFSYIESDPTTQQQEIRSFDPTSDKDELVFNGNSLTFPSSSEAFNYKAFQWTKDSKFILFQSNFRPVWRNSGKSDYYFYTLANKSLKLVAKNARTAEVSPNGQMVGYEREGDMFFFNFADEKETQLTTDAQSEFYNGRFGWAYEEEFGLAQAWKWSPDSRYIAFWQSDERDVPVFQMTEFAGQHAEFTKIRYPKPGDTNPSVKIGAVDVTSGEKKWMDIDLKGGYIPRIYWTARPGHLAVVHLNRAQTHLTLYLCDVTTGKSKVIMEEKSEVWIDVNDFFAGIDDLFYFPKDVEEFYWVSDRDGWSHLYRFDLDGKLLNQVTKGEWDVTYIHNIDPKKQIVYYSSTEESPLERHLYSIRFNGKKKTKLTKVSGKHDINFSPNSEYYIDTYSNVNTPTQVELWSTKGKMVKSLENNAEVNQFIENVAYAKKELMSFTTSDGQQLDIHLIKPVDFDANKKYPMVLNIYGGPGAQSVYNSFATNGWEQYLAQNGYIIASVNNRGTGGYGKAFEKIVYKQLGKWESHDFVETAKYLASQAWVDGDNMAIRGHSYGGYMSSFTMLKHPGVFKVSLVGAPVTDWKLYDSIYAERYMGLLNDNKKGYETSAVMPAAGNLQGHMFIAHSAMDENVHLQNTMQLVKALIDKGKDADLRIYPPGAHGVAYNYPSYVLLYQQYTDYLNKHLKETSMNN
ncbi:DPP IV N-terminal domain-containing protein [Rapidithrix thailandica]|uniref:DPP IV N-terminal domain-containing protein n=1 Tax=Rapidithrix thailandica TaxID=413964 RepID=A0AAW9S835_9BACT